jgi:hypothetical protein
MRASSVISRIGDTVGEIVAGGIAVPISKAAPPAWAL